MVKVGWTLSAAYAVATSLLTASPSPSPSSSSPLTRAPASPAPASGFGVVDWVTIVGLPVAAVGVILGFLMWRQGVAARNEAKVTQARAADLEREAAAARQREQKASVYRRLHQIALYRGDVRAYHWRQRFKIVDSDGEPINADPPEPPLSPGELQELDFDAQRIASPQVLAAVQTAQDAQNAWLDAVRDHSQATDMNKLNIEAGDLGAVISGEELNDLVERRDKAAEAADRADRGLMVVMLAETSTGENGEASTT